MIIHIKLNSLLFQSHSQVCMHGLDLTSTIVGAVFVAFSLVGGTPTPFTFFATNINFSPSWSRDRVQYWCSRYCSIGHGCFSNCSGHVLTHHHLHKNVESEVSVHISS